MTFDLQQAIQLLKDLLWLKTSNASGADRDKIDSVLEVLLEAAFKDVARLMDDWTREVEERALRIIAAQAQAEIDVVEAEELAARALIQDELDRAQRQERHLAGVS